MGRVIAKKIRGMNLWAKVGLVLTLTLALGAIMYRMSESAPTANGRFIFSNNTTTPQVSAYTASTNTFGAASATVVGAAQAFMVDRASATRNEHIAGYVTTGGVLYIMRWNGTAWTNEWNVTVGGDGVNGRRFDIAYEKTSGNAMVVYSTNVTTSGGAKLAYRKWNGSAWDATATNITAATSNIVAAMTWVKLKSNPVTGSNEIALLAADTGTTTTNTSNLSAFIWNGTAWTEAATSPTASAGATLPNTTGQLMQNDCFDMAYSSVSGNLLVVFTTASTAQQWWMPYTSSTSTWGTATSYGTTRAAPLQMIAEPDPQSDKILVMFNRSASTNVYANVWSGTAVGTTTTVSNTNGATTAVNKKQIAAKWLVVGGTSYAVPMWAASTAGTIGYAYYTGTTWTSGASGFTYVTGTGATPNWMDTDVDPQGADTMMLTFSTGAAGTGSLWAKRLVLSAGPTFTWSNADGGTAESTTLASATTQNFSFEYDRYVVVGATTLGNGVAGTTGNVCPGTTSQKLDGLSFVTSAGTDSVTGLTVTTTGTTAIANVSIWNEAGTTQYFSTVSAPSGNNWVFSGGTPIPVTTTAANFKVLVTYDARAVAPAGNTATTANVTAFTSSLTAAGTDTADTTLTLTNTHNPAAWGANTAGNGQNTLNWTYGAAGENVIIVRYTANTDTTAPTDGTTYTAGSAFGVGGTVRYVGNLATFTDTGLTNGATYYYKIFEYDGCTNYAAGVWSAGLTPSAPVNSTTAGTATASQASGASISVSMPYTNDANANNTYTVAYGPSSTGPWTSWATAAAHVATPYTTTITGLTTGSTYYVQCTYNDVDTVTGANPQVVGPITLSVWADNALLHNSNRFTGTTKWGGSWGVPGGKYGGFSCTTCHVRTSSNIKRIRTSITNPAFIVWSSNAQTSVNTTFSNVTSMGHDNRVPNTTSTNICEVCHSQNKYHNYNANRNTLFTGGNTTHNNGADCTACHPHNAGFKASESPGNLDCSSCHNDIYGQMNGSASTYHHYMQNAGVSILGSTTKYPNSATPTTTDTNRRCLMCHVDHDIFRPDKNPGNGQRGANLRADATGTVTTTSGFNRKDFDNSQTNGGLCVSCHTNQQIKNTSNQKSDGTTVTPIITKAGFYAAMHNYTTNSNALSDGTKMNANCVKCHDAQNAEASQKTNFGAHDNTARRLVTALGGTLADPYEEQFCYRCHSKTTDAVGGTVKPAAGRDWYNAAAMTTAAEDTFSAFNGKTYGHLPGNYSGIHKPTTTDETFAYISANKHVECADCHDPHMAQKTVHTAGTNAIAATSPLNGIEGVATPAWPAIWTAPAQSAYGAAPVAATYEWQVCFKCHSGANSNVATWGGTLAAAWTDLGLEFNPNNRSVHPVVSSLNNQTGELAPKAEIATAMVAPWTAVGTQTMFCSDCHQTDSTGGSKGPHGSAVKWMLAGANKAWPYNNSTLNGTNGTTNFILDTASTTSPTATGGVFCLNCHTWTAAGAVHTDANHNISIPCVGCHIRVPHGGKVSNFISTNTAGKVARYSPTGDGGGTVYLSVYLKPATRGSYTTSNCQSANSACGTHSGAVTGESW